MRARSIELIVQPPYEGQWPYELASQLSKILPKHISYTNPSWWSNAWIGCTNLDYERCYASSLIPYTEVQTQSVYSVISMGLLTGDSTLLHLRLTYPHVIREDGSWRQVDISLCRRQDHDILCMPGQYTAVDEKCWEDSSLCVLDGENIASKGTTVYYLGHRRVCFFVLKDTNVSLVMKLGCSVNLTIARGAWCTLGGVSEIQTQEWNYVVPHMANLSVDVNQNRPVNLRALNLGMGRKVQEWLTDWDRDESLMKMLQQERANATIAIYHDQNVIKEVVHQLEDDVGGSWWEVIFGHSSKANSILNYLIHPVVILLIIAAVSSLVQVGMCCWTRHLYRKVSHLSIQVEGRIDGEVSSYMVEALLPVQNPEIPLTCQNCGRKGHCERTCLILARIYSEEV